MGNAMIYKCNANLANELSNLCHRVCTLAYKNCNQAIPTPGLFLPQDEQLLNTAKSLREKSAASIASQAISSYCESMIAIIKDANKYIDVMEPWRLKKTDPERMSTVLYVLLETLRYAGIMYQPLIPDSASQILDQINVPENERTFAHLESCPLKPASPMDPPKIIFSRFDIPQSTGTTERQQSTMQKKQKKRKEQLAAGSKIEIDISRLDIRVGIITKAWNHEEADKLFCEEVDIGEETGPRKIASGLREHYNVEDLVGQRVLVLSNLKSRKLVGFPSHGMVLCASLSNKKVEFVQPPANASIGERVFVEGFSGDAATENQVGKKKMLDLVFPDLKTNTNGIATYRGVPLMTSAGACVAQSGLSGADVS